MQVSVKATVTPIAHTDETAERRRAYESGPNSTAGLGLTHWMVPDIVPHPFLRTFPKLGCLDLLNGPSVS